MWPNQRQLLLRLSVLALLGMRLMAQAQVWQIGVDDNQHAEFSSQNEKNDPPPGLVTTSGGTPAVDDDFYFAGDYPAGFNGLTSPRPVASDEAVVGWERGHTEKDRTNRVHFVLSAGQVGPGPGFRLHVEFSSGGFAINSVPQSGFGNHDMVIRFRNGLGAATELYAQRIAQRTNLVFEFLATDVNATAGANTVEIVRAGPNISGTTSYIRYDFVRLEAVPSNSTPVLADPADAAVDELALLSFNLQASDADVPAQTLTYSLLSGPDGLTVSSAGVVHWIPTEAQGPGVYPVSVQVTDSGTPPLGDSGTFQVTVHEVADPPARSLWPIGLDDNQYSEFSSQNEKNDPAPGQVTTSAGTPAADDDFYFAGVYPTGFNGLTAPRSVGSDEVALGWERGHTEKDRTNRVHWVLAPTQVGSGPALRLTLEFGTGGSSVGGVTQPGFGVHDMAVRFRNGSGAVTPLLAFRATAPTNVVLEFSTAAVGATAGPNTLEIERTGPIVSGTSSWIRYDHLRIESLAPTNTPPTLAALADPTVDEGALLTVQLAASDADLPAQLLTFSRISGPEGLTISATGLVAWTPGEAHGPASHAVEVRVTDNGTPPLSATRQFQVVVLETNAPPMLAAVPDQTIPEFGAWSWDLVPSEPDLPANALTFEIQQGPPGMTVTAGGRVEWTPGEPEGPGQHPVTARVTDNGVPPLSGTVQFVLTVQEINQPPVLTEVPEQTLTEGVPLALMLSATDPDLPAGSLTFHLDSGPPGLQVSAEGLVSWAPSPAYDATTNEVVVSVTDWEVPPLPATRGFRVIVPRAASRSSWNIGVQDDPLTPPYLPSAEFGEPDGIANSGPGAVTRSPGDPGYAAATNPSADDDHYFRGLYPAGFHGNAAPLDVSSDEPANAWEKRLTTSDPANRLHFVLTEDHLAPRTFLTLTLGLPAGGLSVEGVPQAGFGAHDLELWFRNGTGTATRIRALRLESPTNLTVDFALAAVGATAGANTLEVLRVGPAAAGTDAWLEFDFVTMTAETRENQPPILDPVTDMTVAELDPVHVSLTASDSETPVEELQFSLVSGPAGLSVSPAGAVDWTPAEGDGPGTYEVTVRVTDDAVPPLGVQTTFHIDVRETNSAPALSAVADVFVDELEPLTVMLQASDGDLPANGLTYSRISGPPQLEVAANGELTWTPEEADGPGIHEVTVQVTDDGTPPLSAVATFAIEVREVNAAPSVTEIPTQAADELSALQFTVAALDADTPANHLTFSLVAGPAGLTISPAGDLSWTPTEADGPGTFEVALEVTDDGVPPLSATTAFTIAVQEVNSAPTLSPVPPQEANPGNPWALTLLASDTDAPANHLTFSLVSGPAGLNVASDGAATWTPAESAGPGTFEVTVQVSDDGTPPLSGTTAFTIEVRGGNLAPSLTDIPPQVIDELATLNLTLTASDSETPAEQLTYSLVSGPEGLGVSPTGQLTWTPAETDGPGTFAVTVRVTDDGSPPSSATAAFSIEVREVNAEPALDVIPLQATDELAPLVLTLSGSDPDAPANLLTYALVSGPAGLEVSPSGELTWTPGEPDGPGTQEVTVQVTDNGIPPLSTTRAFSIEVHERNEPPTLAPVDPLATDELATLTLTLSALDSDLPANDLTYALVSGPQGLSVSPAGDLLWTPAEVDGPGNHEVVVQVTDGSVPPLSVTNTFFIEVRETNAAPALAAIPAQEIGELTPLELTLAGSDDDLPLQSLTYSLVDGPAQLTVSPEGLVHWVPDEAHGPSTNIVRVRVEDSGNPALGAMQEFTVVIGEVNSAPALDAVPLQTADPVIPWSLQLTAGDSDLPANALTFALESGPDGLTVGPDGLAAWQPTAAQRPSTNLVTVRVEDDGTPMLSGTHTFTVVAAKANTPPTLSPVPDVTIPESAPWSLQLSGSDEDQAPGTLVFSKRQGPSGLSVSPAGTVLWTPPEADGPASHTVSIILSDTGTPPLSVTNEFTVTVQEINQPPVLPALATRYVGLGSSLVFHWTAADPDLPRNSLTHRRVSGPDGLKVNQAGLVTWTPVASQAPSTNLVQVAVSDDGTPSLSTTNQFTVICTVPTRSLWQIGTDNNPAVLPYLPQAEFSVENGKNDAPPGKVTRLPSDPEYVAATNPTAEDDFYFSGLYPAGFNGLITPLSVPNDEPSTAWERALTSGDRTNRIHLMLGAGEVFLTSTLQLSFELLGGGSSVGGVVQSGFAEHTVSVVFRNPLGLATLVFSNRLTAGTNVVLSLSNAAIGASEGPNTIEFVRTGPGVSGTTFWIQFDYVRLQLDQGQQPIGDAGSLPASWAADNYLNPANPADLASDRDLDGLTALQEFNRGAQSTDPNKADTDEDGLSDSEERAHGSNPLLKDTDGDGISDREEIAGVPPSSPLAVDSDGDGASDLHERRAGTDPENPLSVPAVFRGGIALNFVSSTDPNGLLGAHAVAGRIPQTVWNQTQAIPGSGRPTGGLSDIVSPIPGQIVRSDGLVLPGVQVAWTSDSTTSTGNLGSGDQVLMNGMLQASPSVPVTLIVSNVPFARYDAYVYVGGTWDGYNGRVRLGTDPGTDRWFSSFSTAPQAALVEIPPGTNSYARGNLVRYSGLTSPHFTLSLTNLASASSLVTLGIHAVQIVDTDLDGDLSGVPDWWELRHGLDPVRRPPGVTDADGDGLTSGEEHLRGSDPWTADTDLDGIPDGQETAANALRHDSDGDGISDRFEQTAVLSSNPNLADTDGDGVGDGVENRYRSDPGIVETSVPGFTGWTPRYSASPARWDWNLENVQLVWDHGAGEMDLDQNNEDQLITFAVRNANSTDSRTLEISLRYYRGVLTYALSSTTTGGFSAAGSAGSRLSDSPTGGQVADLTRPLGFSGYGPADISDRIAFRITALRGSGNAWSVSFEIWNQTRNQLLVSRWFDNCTAAASVDNGTAVWTDTDGIAGRSLLAPHKGVTLYFSPTPLESLPALAAVRDTDDDGMPDAWETTHGLAPLNPADAERDLDNDRLANRQEFLRGTNPRLPDTDGDRIADGLEVANASDPAHSASRPPYAGFSWPVTEDLDANGLPDAWEIRYRAFGLPLSGDADGDGHTNSQEALWGTNPFDFQSGIALSFVALPPDVELRWPLEPLKRQALFWKSGTNDWMEYTAPPLTVDGVSFVRLPDRIELEPTELYRVDTWDQDYDGDGVSDWAEGVLGSDPFRADSIRSAVRRISATGQIGGVVSGDYVHFVEQLRNGPVTASQAISRVQAARLLQQATFGPTRSDLDRAQQLGVSAWIDEQIARPPSWHLPYLQAITDDYHGPRVDPSYQVTGDQRISGRNMATPFARAAMSGPDQLRQRVAFALSQILVISRNDATLDDRVVTLGSYYDLLVRHAFGSYLDLLRDVTFHPAMGIYLSAVGNQKARPEINQYPDENYAREVMQLFTIGLWELNPDGTRTLNAGGSPVPTYGNREITEMARVFTGLWFGGERWGRGGNRDQDGVVPMDLWADRHDFEAKTLLRGFVIPARSASTRNAVRDLDDALRHLVEHPNTAPFISRQLIQFLVTSNPTTNYVARVSAVFANDGSGRRGNLGAVIRAILLDPEARDPEWALVTPGYGRLKEPVQRAMNLARVARLGRHQDLLWWNLREFYGTSLQEPLLSPSVFNFFRPDYQPPGILAAQGLVGPAFQILDSYSSIAFPNKLWEITERGFIQAAYAFSPDYTDLLAIAEDAPRLLDEVNLLFCGGQMSAATRRNLRESLEQLAPHDRLMRVQLAVYLAATCPDGAIQR